MKTKTTRAAIYARKSTDQSGIAAEGKSVPRQVDGARKFIEQRGWVCVAVYEDRGVNDRGVSGAVFANREHFQRMMRDAAAGAFDAIVLFDLDRFGRRGQKTMAALNALMDLAVWDYSTGRQIDVESFEGETLTFLRARFAQLERDQSRKRTREAMYRKFEMGDVVGCKVFGYDNVAIAKGRKRRQINDEEAAVVREIFERYAKGDGLKRIAHALNARGVASPRPQRGRPRDGTPRPLTRS